MEKFETTTSPKNKYLEEMTSLDHQTKNSLQELQNAIRRNQENKKEKKWWEGPKLTKSKWTIKWPTGKETRYNQNMDNVIKKMHKYPKYKNWKYWVRKDGVKMFGPKIPKPSYVIVAANFKVFPRGTLVDTSLGKGIVCDTGGMKWTHLDIATNR